MTSAEHTIVHVVTRYARGGSEQRLRDLCRAVDDARHVVLVGEESDVALAGAELAPAHVEVLRDLRREVAPRADASALRALVRRLRAERPQVLVTHQSKAGVLGRLAGRMTDVAVVHSLSMASFGDGYGRIESTVFRALERAMARQAAAYLVVGHDLAEQYVAIGAPAPRMHVIRSAPRLPSVPEDRSAARRELRDRAGIDGDRPVVAYVGSLDERKNVALLPTLLARVAARLPEDPPVLVVAGDGPLRSVVDGVDDVVLLGHLDDPAPVFQGADVIVLLSRAEGLPQVLVQAAAAGTPFVAFEVSGARELIASGAVGTVVRRGDLDAAARAVAGHVRERGAPARTIDLTEWEPDVVHQRYAEVLAPLLAEVRP